ncbi:MAG: CoB--CoM heterodisulfide reductase subunit C [Candidatus Thorarchaeota archaeon]|nr:MAG: CoB--CoM heterodisulfide reductase subunit C [Candidatus Thorarchaeota archaeon]RLI62629.1 MAG: CoB--CoM heterodisulfide reductase subunit C [Candidatus Thorarchaeota archaeon]
MTSPVAPEIIDDEDINPEFVDTIVRAGADRIRTCIQCGTCSSVCPSGRRTAFRTRELIRKALLGLKEEVLTSPDLWLCATCLTCLERCPRQIKVTDAIIIMRNMAVEEGYMLPQHRKASRKLIKTGHAVPIDDANREMRRELGLQEIPPTTHASDKALQQVQEIMRRTGFIDLIEKAERE